MIATILGILLFLYLMLSINHANTPPANRERFTNTSNTYFQGVLKKENPIVTPTISESVVPLDEIVYKNIAKNHPTPLNWFLCPHPDLPAPSVAEQMIIDELNKYKVKWYREVSFYGLQVKSKSYPRYDLWIPSKRLIIEYDGQAYHDNPHTKAMDKLKNQFCKDNHIRIIRWNRSHYYHIPTRVASLMDQYNISRK